MKAIYSVTLGLLMLAVFSCSQIALAKNDKKAEPQDEQKRPLSLYLTHGASNLKSQELERVGIAKSAFAIGAGVGFDLTNEMTLNTELLYVDSYRRVATEYANESLSPASARYHQDRVTLGFMWKRHVAKNLYLFPEAGVSANLLKLTLVEKTYRIVTTQKVYGWYAGIGIIIPIKRVFFDIRHKYQEVNLDMKELGADKMMYQSTTLVGFGFVI